MSKAAARTQSNTTSAGALALAVLCARQFVVAYESVPERAGGLVAICRR